MRSSWLAGLVVLIGTALACSSGSTTPKPTQTVNCSPPGITISFDGSACRGVCVAQETTCEGDEVDAASCPAGTMSAGLGLCSNGALCCIAAEGGVETDGAVDATSGADGAADAGVETGAPDAGT
jgi:hypothetical protein